LIFFFKIENFLDPSIYNHVFLNNDIDYDILNSSLEEIDYNLDQNEHELKDFSYLK